MYYRFWYLRICYLFRCSETSLVLWVWVKSAATDVPVSMTPGHPSPQVLRDIRPFVMSLVHRQLQVWHGAWEFVPIRPWNRNIHNLAVIIGYLYLKCWLQMRVYHCAHLHVFTVCVSSWRLFTVSRGLMRQYLAQGCSIRMLFHKPVTSVTSSF